MTFNCRQKISGTTPGNFKVVGSNLQSELVFRIHNYEFSHHNDRLWSSHPHHRPITPHSPPIWISLKITAGNARATIASNLGAWRREHERWTQGIGWHRHPASCLLLFPHLVGSSHSRSAHLVICSLPQGGSEEPTPNASWAYGALDTIPSTRSTKAKLTLRAWPGCFFMRKSASLALPLPLLTLLAARSCRDYFKISKGLRERLMSIPSYKMMTHKERESASHLVCSCFDLWIALAVEYQLATETPLGKTPKKKKIKRKPYASLLLNSSHCRFTTRFWSLFLLCFQISGGSILLLSELSFVCWQLSEYELDRE